MLFFLTLHKKIFSTLIVIRNVLSSNQHIEWFLKRSCDTKYWRNEAENTGINSILHIFKYNFILSFNNISQYCCFYYIFDQINVVLVNRRLSKTIKKLPTTYIVKHKCLIKCCLDLQTSGHRSRTMSESSNHSGRERSSSLANQGSPPPIPEAPPQDEPKKTKKDSPKKVHIQ